MDYHFMVNYLTVTVLTKIFNRIFCSRRCFFSFNVDTNSVYRLCIDALFAIIVVVVVLAIITNEEKQIEY